MPNSSETILPLKQTEEHRQYRIYLLALEINELLNCYLNFTYWMILQNHLWGQEHVSKWGLEVHSNWNTQDPHKDKEDHHCK